MKNVLKRFGNLTQARSAKVPLVIIALVAVIGFSFAACDNGSGGGGGGGGGGDGDDPSPYLGETLTISGEQVYTFDEDAYKFTAFNGNLKLKEQSGASGKIEGGKLTFTLVTPTSGLKGIDNFFEKAGYSEVKSDPPGAKYIFLMLYITESDEYGFVEKWNTSGTDTNYTDEYVWYVYVDMDAKITGKGTTTQEGGYTYKSNDFNLSLKKGWNTVCDKSQGKGETETESMSLSNPKNLKWVLNTDTDYYDEEDD